MDVLDSLSVAQRETLASFQAITNTDNLDTSVTVLNSTDWNLEVSRAAPSPVGGDGEGPIPARTDETGSPHSSPIAIPASARPPDLS